MINLNDAQSDESLVLDWKTQINAHNENYVICKHGKSKHSGVWHLGRLIESNRQLKQVDEQKCGPAEFVRPSDGNICATLSSRALIFD